jgi:hypothetical protein
MERQHALILLLVLILGGAYLYQTGYFPVQKSESVVTFQRIADGENASISRKVNYRIISAEELGQLWNDLNITEPLPSIDFSKNEVAAVFAGLAPTYGYDIGVIKVADSKEVRTVLIELKQPESECAKKKKPTSPFELIMLPKTTLPLTHIDQPVTVACPG